MSESIGKLRVEVTADIAGLHRGLNQASKLSQAYASRIQDSVRASEKLSQASGATASQVARLQNEAIRAARASGDHAGALRLVEHALQGANVGAERQLSLLRTGSQISQQMARDLERQAAAHQRAGQAAQRSSGIMGGLSNQLIGMTAGVASLSFAYAELVKGMNDVAVLDQNRRTLGVLLGSVERGNKVFADAAAWGRKFGYTQTEMGEATASAARIMRKSTADVETVLSVLARLQQLSPEQGITGAVMAMNELNSGSITSLVQRFEVSREAARQMKEEIAGGADVVAVLDRALIEMGATEVLLDQRMQGPNKNLLIMKQAADDASISLGKIGHAVLGLSGLPETFSRAATGLKMLTDDLPRFIEAVGQSDKVDGFHQQILAGAKTYAEYRTQVQGVNAQLPFYTSSIEQLTPEQFALAQQFSASSEAVLRFKEGLAVLTGAMFEAVPPTQVFNTELADNITKAQDAEVATRELTSAQAYLADLGGLVAAGLMTSGDAALLMAQKYNIAIGKASELLNLQVQLAGGATNAIGGSYIPKGANVSGNVNGKPVDRTARDRAAEERKARKDYEFSRMTDAQQKAELERRAAIQKRNSNEEAYYDTLKQIDSLSQSMAAKAEAEAKRAEAEAKRSAKAGEKAAREAERDAERLEKARFALMSDAEKHAHLLAELAANPPETERLELMKDIQDIEQKIADTRLKLERVLLNDRKARPEELKRLEQARRVLESSTTSQAQKDAARLAIAEVQQDQAERRSDIVEYQRSVGGAAGVATTTGSTAGAASRSTMPVGVMTPVGGPHIPTGALGPARGGAGGDGGQGVTIVNNFIVDGKTIATEITPYALNAVLGSLRAANRSGTGREG